ncbi:hypothetical protein ACGF0J_02695 [Nonomuraea sp. NPDC047897]|uniref:hypothetical protein n=1 Tax=Nonomuraea sp. NPDC047897 TaxID=3364346 RepID=UPI00371993FD
MSTRSRLWWAVALSISGAGVGYALSLDRSSFIIASWVFSFCPGREVGFQATRLLWEAAQWVPPFWYGAAPLVVLALGAHWLATRRGRPRAGRVAARVAAGAILLLHGLGPAGLAVDLALDRSCLESWGGWEGARFFLDTDVAPIVAAFCVLAAVRIPRHRVRRLLRSRPFRRWVAGVAVVGLLAQVPVADLAAGPITSLDRCGDPYRSGERVGGLAFLCGLRRNGRFTVVGDHLALAYGRARCAAYRPSGGDSGLLAPICPAAAAVVRREAEREAAEWRAEEAAAQRVCDRARHRPRVRPLRVVRERTRTDYGVLESVEWNPAEPEYDPYDLGLLAKAQDNGLVAARPGHLIVLSHSDFEICLTAETYRRRPPVEVKGWDSVVEVGYESTSGSIELMDPMAGEGLAGLAFRGKGHYRVRVHYREPDYDAWTPQHLLIMIFPGRGEDVVEFRRPRRES